MQRWHLTTVAAALCATKIAWILPVAIAEERRAPASTRTELADIERQVNGLYGSTVGTDSPRSRSRSADQRMAEGDQRFALNDYGLASLYFLDVVDSFPAYPDYPRAVFMLAESLWRAGDREGARKNFERLLERCAAKPCPEYAEPALSRLLVAALSREDWDAAENYAAYLPKLAIDMHRAASLYFLAKYQYFRFDKFGRDKDDAAVPDKSVQFEAALRAFEKIPSDNPYFAKARYFLGVIYVRRGNYPAAVEHFQQALREAAAAAQRQKSPADAAACRAVADLSLLALGRLHYELGQVQRSVDAYQAIARSSPRLSVALYEIAWVYLRQGDTRRAVDTLEVLSLVSGENADVLQGRLLLGNLLVQDGRYEEAAAVFAKVRARVGPVVANMEQLKQSHPDLSAYFRLVLQSSKSPPWPEELSAWTRNNEALRRPRQALLDVQQIDSMNDDLSSLIDTVDFALASGRRVASFQDTRRYREHTIVLRNRLACLAGRLVGDVDDSRPQRLKVSAPLASRGSAVEQRRDDAKAVCALPMNQVELRQRDEPILQRFEKSAEVLQRLEVELMGIEANIAAAEYFINSSEKQSGKRADAAAIRAAIVESRTVAAAHREKIQALRRQIRFDKLGVGVGDERYVRDAELRRSYLQLVEREFKGRSAIGKVPPDDELFQRIRVADGRLDAFDEQINRIVDGRSVELLGTLDEQKRTLAGYRLAAQERWSEATETGALALEQSYDRITQRFGEFLTRADIGSANVSWGQREEHREVLDLLSRQRAERLRALDEDYLQVVDDAESKSSAEER